MGAWQKFKDRFTKKRILIYVLYSIITQIPQILQWLAEQMLAEWAVNLINLFIGWLPEYLSKIWLWAQNNPILFGFVSVLLLFVIIFIYDLISEYHKNKRIDENTKGKKPRVTFDTHKNALLIADYIGLDFQLYIIVKNDSKSNLSNCHMKLMNVYTFHDFNDEVLSPVEKKDKWGLSKTLRWRQEENPDQNGMIEIKQDDNAYIWLAHPQGSNLNLLYAKTNNGLAQKVNLIWQDYIYQLEVRLYTSKDDVQYSYDKKYYLYWKNYVSDKGDGTVPYIGKRLYFMDADNMKVKDNKDLKKVTDEKQITKEEFLKALHKATVIVQNKKLFGEKKKTSE